MPKTAISIGFAWSYILLGIAERTHSKHANTSANTTVFAAAGY